MITARWLRAPLGLRASALVLVTFAAAATARAQTATPLAKPAPTCDTTELPALPVRPYPLFPVRHNEIWIDAAYLGDWSHGHDASGGITVEYVRSLTDDQRVRLGMGATFQMGSWSRAGESAVVPAMSFRGSFTMDDFFDVYGLAKAGVVVADSGAAFRGGGGLGVRVGRLVDLEVTVDALGAIGKPFVADERWIPGFGVSLGFDICATGGGCSGAPKVQTTRNFTCDLYDRAFDVCSTRTDAERADLCAAVGKAIDPDLYSPADGQDSTDAFLAGLRANVKSPGLADIVQTRLVDPHRALLAQRTRNQETERLFQQTKQAPAQHCRYMPYPAELRTALGCDATPPSCQRVVCRMDAPAP